MSEYDSGEGEGQVQGARLLQGQQLSLVLMKKAETIEIHSPICFFLCTLPKGIKPLVGDTFQLSKV